MEKEKSNENGQEADLDAWDEFLAGNFLKADLVVGEDEAFPVIKSEVTISDEEPRVRLHLKKEGLDKLLKFDLNKTNAKFIKDEGIPPTKLTGLILYFTKVKARDPKKNIEVDSLRIRKIENFVE